MAPRCSKRSRVSVRLARTLNNLIGATHPCRLFCTTYSHFYQHTTPVKNAIRPSWWSGLYNMDGLEDPHEVTDSS